MKHTILFLAANPREMEQIALQEECAAIERELRMTSRGDDFDFRSGWAVSVDDLMRYLNELSPTVLHFSGHGTGRDTRAHVASHRDIESSQGAGIFLEDGKQPQYVSDHALANMIASASRSTRLVVLNACYSATIADSLCQVVDCVIGIDGAIEDTAARTFAVALYRALGHRHSVGKAVAQARATLEAKQQSEHLPVCRPRDGLVAEEIFLSGTAEASDTGETRASSTFGGIAMTSAPASGRRSSPLEAAGEGYDLFLAHPSANRSTASALFDLLQPEIKVFLAGRSLRPSDHWNQEAGDAHRASRATVLLISSQSDAAWYLGDEIITAIALHRASPDWHRLLPIRLEANIPVPLSLSHLCAIDLVGVGGLASVAALLRGQVVDLRQQTATSWVAPEHAPSPQTRSADRRDHFVLYERLGQVTDSVFEQIVSRVGIDRTRLAPRTAPVDQRALDVAQLAALDPTLSRRVSAELDRQAPWTRR
jgi:hypothetical protein